MILPRRATLSREVLVLLPLRDATETRDAYFAYQEQTLGQFVAAWPCAFTRQLAADDLAKPLHAFQAEFRQVAESESELFAASGMPFDAEDKQRLLPRPTIDRVVPATGAEAVTRVSQAPHEAKEIRLDDRTVVRLAYSKEIDSAASFLRAGLSALIFCDKLVVEQIAKEISIGAAKRALLLAPAEQNQDQHTMGGSMRQRQIGALREQLKVQHADQVLVIPHLDLLAGGTDKALTNEARDVTEILYGSG